MIGAGKAAPFVRRALIALGAALVAFALLGRESFSSDGVHFAVDTATSQQPWADGQAPSNPELTAQGSKLYPHYRSLARRWATGECPLWNADLRLGVPELAEPERGALDPQVALLGWLERVGGREFFDRGFAWLAWLRVFIAVLGSWCLARTLGLGRAPSALAALGYGLSGAQVLWLHMPQGHVSPFLPWVLVGIERLATRIEWRSSLLAFGSMLLAILGGQLETALFVGLIAGLWCLHLGSRDRRAAWTGLAALAAATLCAGPLLLPFYEALTHSGAWTAAVADRATPDWVALGALLIAVGVILRLRDFGGGRASPVLVALVLSGLAYAMAKRGLGDGAALAFWPDLFGRPHTASGYGGAATYLETASAWIALPVFVLALAGVLGGAARHPRLRLVSLLGLFALALAWGAPGIAELWERLPGIGRAAPSRAAPVAALLLSLTAASALESSPSWARRAAVLSVLAFAFLATGAGGARPLPAAAVPLDPPLDLIRIESIPPPRVSGGIVQLSGALHPGLPAGSVELRMQRLDERGRAVEGGESMLVSELVRDERGWNRFDSGPLEVAELEEGERLFSLRILGAAEDRPLLDERRIARTFIARKQGVSAVGVTMLVLSAVLIWLLPSSGGAWLIVLLALVQGLWFGRGWNPFVPNTRGFEPTQTTAVLAERLGSRRVFAGQGLLPDSTPLVAGLATLGGRDAHDPLSFDQFRPAALRAGSDPVLDWNADHAATDAATFRLLGAGALVTQRAAAPPGWSTIAGPDGFEHEAELFIAIPDDPLPLAFCVPRVTPRADLLQRVAEFDPRAEAFVDDDQHFVLEQPFTTSHVEHTDSTPERESFQVELDGDALFLHSAQHHPGWKVTIDGEPRELLRVNTLFRGVRLEAGRHEVVFRYRPASWRLGWWCALAGFMVMFAVLRGTRTPMAP